MICSWIGLIRFSRSTHWVSDVVAAVKSHWRWRLVHILNFSLFLTQHYHVISKEFKFFSELFPSKYKILQQLPNGNSQKHSQSDGGYEFCCHHVLVFRSEFTVTLCHSHIILHLKSHHGTTISFKQPTNQSDLLRIF